MTAENTLHGMLERWLAEGDAADGMSKQIHRKFAADLQPKLDQLQAVVERMSHVRKRVPGAGFGGETITLEECLPSCKRCQLQRILGTAGGLDGRSQR